jgi:predicted ATPase/serine/threonine protein kinase
MSLRAGTKLGPYEILSPLGAGGMGEVYRARDTRLGRDVAIKVMSEVKARNAEALERFEREARAASSLNHPNIVTIYDIGRADCEAGSIAYIAMELVEGLSLRQMVSGGPLDIDRLLEIATQTARALAVAHGKGIVHRDLKPENIMVSHAQSGQQELVKILDFGLAKLDPAFASNESSSMATTGGFVTQDGYVMGTIGYMSPEQARGRPTDFRSDQFSFGAILYEVATGRRAFDQGSGVDTLAAIIRDDPESIGHLNPRIPLPLQWTIKRCLAKNPDDRFASTVDLAAELSVVGENLAEPVAAAAEERPHNLPLQRTPLIGREKELAAVKQLLLRPDVRLVALTGPGGTGKTRLAVQLAEDLVKDFKGGIFFVSLALITDANLVASTVAEALGIRESGGKPILEALKEQLRQLQRAPMLLILDNFEQVSSAAPLLADLLEATPVAKILVTSRSLLHLYGEHEFSVPPLSLPDLDRLPDVATLAANPAVSLFLQRATALKPDFALNAENMHAVAEICARLDGLPLAIELAAARIKLLSPAAMLARLQSRLQWLTGGARDLPERQQTMRATLDWSYELLQPGEQKLFRRLAVFVSGCTLESVEAGCNPKNDLQADLLDAIASLVDKSLLQQSEQDDGEARFRMLETIREYAAGRLAESGEEAATRRAEAAYCIVLAEEGAVQLTGPRRQDWLNRFDLEHENFRSTLDWLIGKKNIEWGLRLAIALNYYWLGHGFPAEGRDFLWGFLKLQAAAGATEGGGQTSDRALALKKLRAIALSALSGMALEQGDIAFARSVLEEALAIYRELGDSSGVVMCLNHLSVTNRDYGDYTSARAQAEETIRICQEAGDMVSVAHATINLASMARTEGDLQGALALHQECFSIYRDLGDRTGMAWSLNHQGDVALEQGDLAKARELYEQALGIFRELEDKSGIARTLNDLGNLACNEGFYDRAQRLYPEALSLFSELGEMRDTTRVLEGIACATADQGNFERALRLAGAAAALRESFGTPLTVAAKAHLDKRLEAARAKLATGAAARAWMEGSRMTSQAAVEYALNGTRA